MPLLILAASSLVGCSNDDRGGSTSSESAGTPVPEASLRCDPLDERACLLPWPNDAFTVSDTDAATGRRLDIHPESTPVNTDGVPIEVTAINQADGFSPLSTILTVVPGIDLEASGIAGVDDVAGSLGKDAPIVLLDTTVGARLPYWAELDASGVVGDQVLMIHPAEPFTNGHHIVVALRNLKSMDGSTIVATTAFEAAVEGTPEPSERAPALAEMFAHLADDEVDTDGLFVAWYFTVASSGGEQQTPTANDASYSDPVDRALAQVLSGEG